MTIKRDVLNVAAIIIGVSLAGYLLVLALNGNEALEEIIELLAELFSIFVSFSIFGVTWYAYGKSRDNHALFMGAAFLVIGFIDLFHTLSYPFMPDFITPNTPGKSAVFWNLARVISAPLFLASAYIFKDTLPALINRPVLFVSAIVISIVSFITGVFYHDYMPAAYHAEGVSFLKIIQALITAIIILYASYLYTRRITEKNIETFLIYGFIITIFSDLIYFSYEIPGHLLKIAGFYFIYLSLYKSSVESPYEKLAIAEEKLRQAAEEKYRNLFDNANDAIIIHDIDGAVISWNHAAEKIFGWTAQEVTGKKLVPIIIPHDRRAEIERVACSVVPGGLTGFEIEFLRKDGSRIVGSLTVSHLKDAKQNVIGASCIIRDITEQKRAQEALKKAKEFSETVLNSMNDAISVIDIHDYRIIDVNTVFLDNYGLKKEDVIGKTCYEITHKRAEPCSPPDDICPLLETLETGKHSTAEHVHYTRDGEKRYVEVATSPIKDETGKVISVIHVARDITERKLSEEKLRESEERYHRLVDFSPYGIAIHSEGKFVFMNLAGAKILGAANPSLLIGKPVLEIIHPDYRKLVKERIRMQEEGKVAPLAEEKFLRLDGAPVDIEIVSIPFTYGGKPAMYGIFRDITERKKAELEYKTILHTAMDGFYVTDAQGRLLDVNDSYCYMMGYSRDELLNMSIKDVEAVETEAIIAQRIKRIMEVGWDRFETRHKRKDGRVIEIEASVNYTNIGGGKFFVFMRDMTEKKIMEKMRLENERLAFANRAKSEFLDTMSHELRTPMNAVMGFSEILKAKIAGELNEKQEKYIDKILASSKRQLGIIETILDHVQIEAGKLELTIEKIAVPETIEETLESIKTIAAGRNVVFKKELDPELEFILADRKRFKQILSNLFDNAVKFSKKEGGTVTVTSKKEGEMAKFSVSDTGIGIKEEDMGKLFRVFQQVDSGTTRRYGGTGLGLAITKQLVELQGGTITVESRFGKGSTFTFTLPLKAKKKVENT